MTFGDTWGCGNPPQLSSVTATGSTINIIFTVRSLLCTTNIIRWSPVVHLGTFAPGVYDIVATIPQANRTLGRAQLIVRDTDYAHFSPHVVIGSLPVSIWTDDVNSVQSVTIDGVTVPGPAARPAILRARFPSDRVSRQRCVRHVVDDDEPRRLERGNGLLSRATAVQRMRRHDPIR